MRQIIINVENNEFDELVNIKKDKTWRQVILTLIRPKKGGGI